VSGRELEARKRELVARVGDWESDNIHLGDGVYTMGQEVTGGPAARLPAILQVAADVCAAPLARLTVLDLGAAEGIFSIELARQGAKVVAIEGREAPLERARFVKEELELTGLELFRDDVRNLSPERYGEFDLVLCLGILYHLPAPDVFELVRQLARVARRAAIIETHVSLAPRASVTHDERRYFGRIYHEHDPSSSPEERRRESRASLDNPRSFWLTRPSLYNLLAHAGFTSVLEVRFPRALAIRDRLTLAAIKGERRQALSAPGPAYRDDWREGEMLAPRLLEAEPVRRALRRVVPARARRFLKGALGRS
jgi:SAM-dependent methyltransferase